jgi:hypothetical protein
LSGEGTSLEELIRQLSRFKHRLSGTARNSSAIETIRTILESFGFQARCDFFRVPGLLVHGMALNILALWIVFIVLKNYSLSLVLYGIVLVSFWGELTISFHFLRRLLPSHKTCNVETCITAESNAAKTIVVVAHHDTPKTGLLYNLGLAERLSLKLSRLPSPLNRFFLPPFVAAIFLGGALTIRPFSSLSTFYAVLTIFSMLILSITFLGVVQIGFSRSSPGGNDNGSGLVVLLELARRFSADKPRRNTLHLLASGAEEAGFFCVKAFMKTHKELDRRKTLFINVESVGGGELHWVTGEGNLQRVEYPRSGMALLDQLENNNAIPSLPRAPILAPTDASALAKKGFDVVTLIALKNGTVPLNYHKTSDTFDKLDTQALIKAADVIEKIIRYYCR